MVRWSNIAHTRTDVDDNARGLVPEHAGARVRDRAVLYREVRMTDATGNNREPDLAFPESDKRHIVAHFQRRSVIPEDRGAHSLQHTP
jgi:hypothetical protein